MNSLNESSFPYPSNVPLTPNNSDTSPEPLHRAPGRPVRPQTRRGIDCPGASARSITFERETVEDSDEESTQGTLHVEDIHNLHQHNDWIYNKFVLLTQVRETEHKRIQASLRRVCELDKKLSDLQHISWNISLRLGRTDVEDYIGL
jgi:hypothetical protein